MRKQTKAGFMLGLEFATKGTMEVDGRKIEVIEKDDQFKPDMAKASSRAPTPTTRSTSRSARRRSGVALAMLPVAEEYKKVLIVEPAVADQITGEKWNRYIFRTGRNSSQDAIANAVALDRPGTSDRHAGAGLRLRPRRRGGVQGSAGRIGARPRSCMRNTRRRPPPTSPRRPAHLRALKDKPGRKVMWS